MTRHATLIPPAERITRAFPRVIANPVKSAVNRVQLSYSATFLWETLLNVRARCESGILSSRGSHQPKSASGRRFRSTRTGGEYFSYGPGLSRAALPLSDLNHEHEAHGTRYTVHTRFTRLDCHAHPRCWYPPVEPL